jgi:GDPmannose 4,6-dehydratase
MKFFTDKLLEISKLNDVKQQVCPKLYRPIDIHYQHGDSSNLLELTNWKPTISIDKTMSDLLNYWMFKIN